MRLRDLILDLLSLATLTALAIAAWWLIPGEAYAATSPAEAAARPSSLPLVFIGGVILICLAWAALERFAARGSDDDQSADEDRAERDLEARARRAEGGDLSERRP